jgi:hypothetical protein
LLGIVEFAAAREREEVHAGPSEFAAEVDRVIDIVAAIDAFVREVSAT